MAFRHYFTPSIYLKTAVRVQSVLSSIVSMIMYLFSPKRCAVTRANRETQGGETIAILSVV